ncbi:nuclear RNA export factor 1/2 [Diplonema papillatum]|nr:nuclear RNA export factor 1/2 [Diplonema papillatum]
MGNRRRGHDPFANVQKQQKQNKAPLADNGRKTNQQKNGGGKFDADVKVVVLKLAIEKYNRYSAAGFLDLTDLSSIAELEQYSPNLNTNMWCSIVAEVIRLHKSCKAVSFDGNKIRNLYHLAKALSDGIILDSLSLQNNDINTVDDVKNLRSIELKHLILNGNPVYKKNATDTESLFQGLKRGLPTLQRIDDVNIDRSSKIDAVPAQAPPPLDAGAVPLMVKDLIGRYHEASQAAAGSADSLLEFYDTDATMTYTTTPNFSLSVSGPLMQVAKRLVANQHNVLKKLNKTATVYTGKLNVGKCLEMLHEVKVKYDPASLLSNTEVSQLPAAYLQNIGFTSNVLVVVNMHGSMSFVSTSSLKESIEYKKYFDRTWLVKATPEGKPVIVNDILHIREPKKEPSPLYSTTSRDVYYGLHMYMADLKVVELCSLTGLRVPVARNCLVTDDAGPWNVEKAKAVVERSMATNVLSPEHFSQVRDPAKIAVEIFADLTGLLPAFADHCLANEHCKYDLWLGYCLFKHTPLRPEHFQEGRL